MASTYTPIATTTLGASASNVTFSSISGSYTDLILVCNTASTASTVGLTMQVNSDTGTNYSQTTLWGDGSSAQSNRATNQQQMNLTYYSDATTTALANTTIVQLNNYSNTTTYKTFISRGNNAGGATSVVVGLWRSTAAINAIKVYSNNANNFAAGSTFTLYGIKAA